MYREIEGYYYLIRSMKLHYGATSANVALRSRGSQRSGAEGASEIGIVIERESRRIDNRRQAQHSRRAQAAGAFRDLARAEFALGFSTSHAVDAIRRKR